MTQAEYDYDRVWRYIADDIKQHQQVLYDALSPTVDRHQHILVTESSDKRLFDALTKECADNWITFHPQHQLRCVFTRGKQHKYLHHALQSFVAAATRVYVHRLLTYLESADQCRVSVDFSMVRTAMQKMMQERILTDHGNTATCRCHLFVVDTVTLKLLRVSMHITVERTIGRNVVSALNAYVHETSIAQNVVTQNTDEILSRIGA